MMQPYFASMTHAITEKDIYRYLHHIIDPVSGTSIVEAKLVSGIVIKGSAVGLMLDIAPDTYNAREPIGRAIEEMLIQVEGIEKVTPVMTASSAPSESTSSPAKRATWNLTPIPHVKRVIAVMSGKGGVGKSLTTALLARAFHEQGLRVGILDADIQGASIAHMFGLTQQPDYDDNQIIPPIAGGIACLSMGMLLGSDQAAIMRGAMVSKALRQFARSARWGTAENPLDLLLIDTPPGTGDVHLSLMQQIPLAYQGGGAIIVTTPQPVATIDAQKCAIMLQKTHTPLLGIIENMSYWQDDSGNHHTLFGEGGGATLAADTNAPLLGNIPLQQHWRESADAGQCATLDVSATAWERVASQLLP